MGFRRAAYRLIWPEGHELHGLEVTTRGLSIGDLKTVAGLAPGAGVKTTVEDLDPLLDVFAKSLVAWNYEDENGQPVGTTREEIGRQDARFLLPVVMTWINEVSTIADPLEKRSPAGASTTDLGSIPMEPLSTNL